jgi:hypothetical protein
MDASRRPLAFIAAGAALFLFLAHGSLLWRAHRHYGAGKNFQAAGKTLEAAREYQSAIGFYAPLNPWSRAAAEALAALAAGQRARDPGLAFELEDRLRRSVQGTRWIVQPYREILSGLGEPSGPPLRDPDPWLFFLSWGGLGLAGAALWRERWGAAARLTVALGGLTVWAAALRFC